MAPVVAGVRVYPPCGHVALAGAEEREGPPGSSVSGPGGKWSALKSQATPYCKLTCAQFLGTLARMATGFCGDSWVTSSPQTFRLLAWVSVLASTLPCAGSQERDTDWSQVSMELSQLSPNSVPACPRDITFPQGLLTHCT